MAWIWKVRRNERERGGKEAGGWVQGEILEESIYRGERIIWGAAAVVTMGLWGDR